MSEHPLKGKKFSVLDHGHVILLDFMGTDGDVVAAARTSYQTGTKHVSDQGTLLRYLMRHRHTTPFESCMVKFHVKLPIVFERQWARHRTAGWSEVSARYSELPDECYVPDAEDVCVQSQTNRQGSGQTVGPEVALAFELNQRDIQARAHAQYKKDLAAGIARETARNSLPLSTYTEKVWWMNLHNILHFLGLRMDSHAQREIREYANVIGQQIVAELFPETWAAFLDYRLHAMQLSGTDIGVIEAVMAIHNEVMDSGVPSRSTWMQQMPDRWKAPKCRERDEFFDKIERLGLVSDQSYEE